MAIFKTEDKEKLLQAYEDLAKMIPVMEMEDRDFTAALLHRMGKVVTQYGPKHGVNLVPVRPNRYERFAVTNNPYAPDGLKALFATADEVHNWPKEKPKDKTQLTEADVKCVIYNPPATVIYWKDGSKTVVKCSDQDFDEGRMTPETGVVYAIAKKVLGNKGNYNDVLRRLVKGAKKA